MSFGVPLKFNHDQVSQIEKAVGSFHGGELIPNIASCSPYLAQAFLRDHDWLLEHLETPGTHLAQAVIKSVRQDHTPISDALRLAKKRTAFLVAFNDLAQRWSVEQVTFALSDFADTVLEYVLQHLLVEEATKSNLPISTPDQSGLVALAMGKHGAHELNYSSDIDVIMLFDDARHDDNALPDIRAVLVRVTKRLVKLLSENTENGYVFRTDLRLRPDPSVTPVCMSMDAAERYYESLGRTWERAAMIKARPAAGAVDAGHAFLSRLTPFVWRRHLDFAAIQDAEDMLLNIRHHKGLTGQISFPGHNIKLGRGGIREIEFFVQTQQLIFGGRDPSVRSARTTDGLVALAAAGKITEERAQKLSDNYRYLRALEHRLQMLDDAQTHEIPKSTEKLDRLAAFCGFTDPDHLQREVLDVLESTHSLTELPGHQSKQRQEPSTTEAHELDAYENEWAKRPALRNDRARELFKNIKPALIARFDRAANPKDALVQFDKFVRELPAGVQLFSLFDANPSLLELVVDICALAPDLARYLGRNAHVLDAVLDAAFYQALPPIQWYLADLNAQLAGVTDYETALDTIRIWQKEQHFRVGVHLLKNLSDVQAISAAYSAIAEASVASALPNVEAHLAQRYGSLECSGVAVLAMGKLGSQDMTAESDLDLIVIYDAPADARSSGRKELPAATYFARLTQALITAMTVPTTQGRLYEVDMRLRPSGKQGPVATSLSAFEAYQRDSAWTWEHLALTRARVVAGPPELKKNLSKIVGEVLAKQQSKAGILGDVGDMLQKLGQSKADEAAHPWNMKHGPGKLMAIELFLQAGVLLNGKPASGRPLDQIEHLAAQDWLSTNDADTLAGAWRLCSAIQHVTRLTGEPDESGSPKAAQAELLCSYSGAEDIEDLQRQIAEKSQIADMVIQRYLHDANSVANQPNDLDPDGSLA